MNLHQLYLQRARERRYQPIECGDRMLAERKRMTPAGRFWIGYVVAMVFMAWWLL